MKYKNTSTEIQRFTLGDQSEHTLAPGQITTLPAENEYIQTLEAKGILERIPQAKQKKNTL